MSAPDPLYVAPPPSRSGLKIAILFGAVIALVAANVYLFLQLDQTRTDMTKLKESLSTEIAGLRETASVTTQTNRRTLESLRDELETARRQASMAAGQAKVEATKHAEELARRLEAEQNRQKQATQKEFTQIKEQATVASAKIGEVSSEVGAVKSEVASTKTELDKTIADLKRVTGDLGVQSGLIATNGKELSALKALGERNYFEFNMGKTKQPQKVGDISLMLKKADPKNNRYTVEIVADDKRVEKKDKNINEPVQFYVSKARQPYELVVNSVKKDVIAGYLSTPKVQLSR